MAMKHKYDYDLLVIGAGSGGLTVAIGGAGIGAKVLLVEAHKLGGDCTHYGCIPSKALIKAAHVAHVDTQRSAVGLPPTQKVAINIKDVLLSVKGIVDDVEKRFEDIDDIRSLGVDVLLARARFIDVHTVQAGDKKISAKKIVIATGARPVELPIPGLTDCKPKTNRTIFEPEQFTSLLIIGTGPIGCELAQAFARLGVKVTMIARARRILDREEERVSAVVAKQLRADGVRILYKKDVVRASVTQQGKCLDIKGRDGDAMETVCADEILVAVGRQPNVEGLGLEELGITFDRRSGIAVDAYTRTTIPQIYAVGDVATRWKFTHYANHMAKTTLAHALLHVRVKRERVVIPRATFTAPEVGSVGITFDTCSRAEQRGLFVFEKAYDHVDRAITDRSEEGFVRLITDKKGQIKGATIVGPSAGELINEVALAMKNGISITKLADTIHAYPTYGYGLRNCADQFRAMGYTEGKKKLIKKIFGLRGKEII